MADAYYWDIDKGSQLVHATKGDVQPVECSELSPTLLAAIKGANSVPVGTVFYGSSASVPEVQAVSPNGDNIDVPQDESCPEGAFGTIPMAETAAGPETIGVILN